ncbi:MAG: hypothetical protein IJS15_17065 [Victivallales bacterium]|nr:hypothetical protein [Victivallales bacterium]
MQNNDSIPEDYMIGLTQGSLKLFQGHPELKTISGMKAANIDDLAANARGIGIDKIRQIKAIQEKCIGGEIQPNDIEAVTHVDDTLPEYVFRSHGDRLNTILHEWSIPKTPRGMLEAPLIDIKLKNSNDVFINQL